MYNTLPFISVLLTDFILYISTLIKEKKYNKLEKIVSRIILNFYFNFRHDGLLFGINKLLFDLHNILVPKSNIEMFSLLFFACNFLPFCTDRACLPGGELLNISIVELLDMTYSIKYYLGLVILTYIIFIVILDLSICYISCNKEVKKFFPSLDFIINLALFLALVILVCILLFLLFLLFDKIVEIFINYISEYIIKMLTSNPGPSGFGTGQPGGFGQPSGGGGKPPRKPGGFSPGKVHYKDKNDTTEDLIYEEGEKRESSKRTKKNPNETEEQKQNRLAKNRISGAKSRAKIKANRELNETPEEKQKRLAKNRATNAIYRRNRTEEQRQNKISKDRARRANNKLR